MTRFLVDNQLPEALTRWLEAKGCQAEHVLTLQLAQANDGVIWERARLTGAAVISKDEDFAQMTLVKAEPVTVIWLRLGNCRTTALLEALERAWPRIEEELTRGARLIEVV